MKTSEQAVLDVLSAIVHPEHEQSIVALELVKIEAIGADHITVRIQRSGGNDPFNRSLVKASQQALEQSFPDVSIEVIGDQSSATASPAREQHEQHGGVARVANTVAIASGKGGVGKSTVTVNIAVALARAGYSVGILDADIFGPSIPLMLGVTDARPPLKKIGDEETIVPIEAFGIKMLSMGFFISPQDALIWRGPMASNALRQLMRMGLWGQLDFLLIDLPPGTSDIHLTLVQETALTGAVIVTTPQKVATADAEKAVTMFMSPDVNVPVLGVVENMAWFEPAELPDHRYYLFGRDGGRKFAQQKGIPFLGEIPIVQGICEGSDLGSPPAAESSPVADAFDAITRELVVQTQERSINKPPSETVKGQIKK